MNKTLLVIATGNPGKIRDFAGILGSEKYEYKTLKDVGFTDDIVEDAETFAGNATIKARAVVKWLAARGVEAWVLADDSGIQVRALNGAPGVYSARYCGVHGHDEENNELLMKNLEPFEDRAARYYCALAMLHTSDPDAEPKIVEGECRGHITKNPRGTMGFGYDPLFVPDDYDKTFAELTIEEKKGISHRGNAIRKLPGLL